MEGLTPEVLRLYDQLRDAVQNRDEPSVAYLLTHHLNFDIAERVDAQKLILCVFRHTNEEINEQPTIIKILQRLLDRGADVNVADTSTGHTVVHLAVASRMTQVIEYLIDRDANLQAREKNGNLILHFLIESEYRKFAACCKLNDPVERRANADRSIDFVRWMVPKLAVVAQCKNAREETALHLAAKYGMLDVMLVLMEYTRDARRYCNDRYLTAFQVFVEAAVCGKMVDTFMSRVDGQMYKNVRTGNIGILVGKFEDGLARDVCKRLLEKKFSVDVVDEAKNTPLHLALKYRKKRLAKLMIKYTKRVNARDADGNTALNIIMNYCDDKFYKFGDEDEKMIRTLICKKAKIHIRNKNLSSPMIAAVSHKKLAVLKIFQASGANFCHSLYADNLLFLFFKSKVNTDAETYQAVFNLLVSQGCNVKSKDVNGMTPLHFAARLDNTAIVERLLKSKVDVNAKECLRGYTPLHEAILHKRLGAVKLLVNSGADVNAKTLRGESPLHVVVNGIEDAVEMLVKKNAYVDVVDDDGFLPLQKAILYQNDRVVKKLLAFGAYINDSYTPVLSVNDYQVSRCITEHLVRLHVAGQPIDDKLKSYLSSSFYTAEIHESCLKEIESLKKYEVNDFTSLYDLLHMNRNFVCNYVENEKLKNLINSTTFEEQFPMYHGLISSTYFMAVRREKLIEPSRCSWLELTNAKLPYLCIYEILSYLSNVDLKLMAKKNQECENKIEKKLK